MNTDQKAVSGSILVEGELTEKILGAAFKVQNKLGTGFLEKVYENALLFELRRSGLSVEPQRVFPVKYEGVVVGEYQADLVVAGQVIVECNGLNNMESLHEAALIKYFTPRLVRVCAMDNICR